VWNCLSLTPSQTSDSLIVFGAYAILFLVSVQRIRETDDVERLLRGVAIAGTGMAALGFVQYLVGNGKYFWCYEHPLYGGATGVSGSFTNRNHFSHFIVLAIGPLIWWIQSRLNDSSAHSSPGRHRHLLASSRRAGSQGGFLMAALGLCVFAVLMSRSRGGIAVMFLAAAVSLVIFYRGDLLDRKTLLFLLGTGLLVAGCLGIYGYEVAPTRGDEIISLEGLDVPHSRRDLWLADLAAVADYPWLGTGIGSHGQVHPMYLPDDPIAQYLPCHPGESGPLQVAMEAGLVGLLLLLAALGMIGYWCWTALHPGIFQRELLCFAGIIPCLLASLLHSLGDSVWYVPGCMVIVVFMAACACRLSQMVRSLRVPGLRPCPCCSSLPAW
jgi:O-antigen ligase